MHKFPPVIADHFTTSIRLRGLGYLSRIDIKTNTKSFFSGSVQGQNNNYLAWLHKEEATKSKKTSWILHSHCSCPFAEKDSHCKHLWALLLLAEKGEWLPVDDDILKYNFIAHPEGRWEKLLKIETSRTLPSIDNTQHYVDIEASEAPNLESDDFSNSDSHSSFNKKKSQSSQQHWHQEHLRHLELKRWRTKIQSLASSIEASTHKNSSKPVAESELLVSYILCIDSFHFYSGYRLKFYGQTLGKNGAFGDQKALRLHHADLKRMTDPQDRHICQQLLGVTALTQQYQTQQTLPNSLSSVLLSHERFQEIVPLLLACGRFFLQDPVHLDQKIFHKVNHIFEDAKLCLSFKEISDSYVIKGEISHKELPGKISDDDILTFSQHGLLISSENDLLFLNKAEDIAWLKWLDLHNDLKIPKSEINLALSELMEKVPLASEFTLPEKTAWTTEKLPLPKVCFSFDHHIVLSTQSKMISGNITLDYGSKRFLIDDRKTTYVDQLGKIFWQRDLEQEKSILQKALAGISAELDGNLLKLPRSEFMTSLLLLAKRGVIIESSTKKIRPVSKIEFKVKSGIDWLDVNSKIEFEDVEAELPALLAAAQQQQDFIVLHDGSIGLIPLELRRKLSSLMSLSQKSPEQKAKDAALRFSLSQALLLDLLLAEEAGKNYDKKYNALLMRFRDLKRAAEFNSNTGEKIQTPRGFFANLRDYQLTGLSWLRQLHDLELGGILADDMGLGKTVQVLAHLHELYINKSNEKQTKAKLAPSLLVVPRSLIYNWQKEAERFSPDLKVLDYSQADRKKNLHKLSSYHLILTTYTMMTKDITELRELNFYYAILDEAQFVKNKNAQSAKAARLLKAKHRLAMSGTPVENHLGELWSLFEFINPGLLGRSSEKNLLQSTGFDSDKGQLELIKRLVKPYILRRTKTQVLKDLPEKTEKTLYCDLESEQRTEYDRLKVHYRASLEDLIEKEGIGRSKIKILEALTRLRQAACHLALIDKNKKSHGSAKLSHLLEQVESLRAEGHKALIFSQFTSMLKLVGDELKSREIPYLYLDGATKNRQELVETYQQSADIQLFLISIKAGGVGLNLTAADYCFILDPWWNPAVEMQAIDRAHRIGQRNPVIAYRLIAKDTVEEKILELQSKKRDLVESVISEDSSLLKKLELSDLRDLLS